jgi:hypothetical protein
VPKGDRKLILVWVCAEEYRGHGNLSWLRYCTGSGCVTGRVFSGDLRGGGRVTGSRVGDTGSSRGMTVYLLTGSPICATADLPWWMASVPPLTDIRQLLE